MLDGAAHFRSRWGAIEIFEERRLAGMGMPYHPETTDRHNVSNISSEELPELTISFASLAAPGGAHPTAGVGRTTGEIREDEVYSRLALGQYLHAQYRALIAGLIAAGLEVIDHTSCQIVECRKIPNESP